MAPILEASSKSWINCCRQWHNLPGTSVGLVSSQLSFEGTVQGKKIQLPPHAAPILSAEQLAMAIPSQQQAGNQHGASNAAGSYLLMERAGSGSNWLGKDFFQQTVLQGDLGRLGPLPMDQTGHTQACCQNPMESPAVGQCQHRALGSSDPAGLPGSLANAAQSSQMGLWL